MSRARIFKAVSALAVLGSLIVVANAGAAAWQGPWQISAPGVNAGDSLDPALMSMGAAGDTAAAWWDPTGVIVSRKPAGGVWSPPLTIGNPTPVVTVHPGIDAAGNVTTAWTETAGTSAVVSDWPVGAPLATSHPLPVAFNVNDLVVNPAGIAVIAGTDPSGQVVVGYRPVGGTFALHTFPVQGTGPDSRPRVAINAAGMAVVIWRDSANPGGLWASTRTAATDWTATPETVTTSGVVDSVAAGDISAQPSVAIDGAGNIFAAFAYSVPPTVAGHTRTVVRTELRPPGGGWQESPDLSTNADDFVANHITVAVNTSGTAVLVWQQVGANSFANIQARYGSTGTGIWGPIETVNDAGADVPVATIGNDGTAMAAWERETMGGNTGQARLRTPGPAGVWTDIHNLSLQHANVTHPQIATDGRGDFSTISTPFDGSAQRVIISAWDQSPPTVSQIAVSGSLLAGSNVSLSVTATDEWSVVNPPTWTFGDGSTGTGLAVAHAYAAAGSYTVHVTDTDSAGNSSTQQVTFNVAASQSALTTATFKAKWKVSRVTGTLTVAGAVPVAGTYAIDVTKGGKRVIHSSQKLPAGPFSKAFKLSGKLLPGTYHVALLPAVPANQIAPAARDAKLAAPAEGVVDRAFMGSGPNAPALSLSRPKKLYATFHFATLPKSGPLKVSWYKVGKKRTYINATAKPRGTKVVAYLGPGTFLGKYMAVLTRKGVTIATVTVRATK